MPRRVVYDTLHAQLKPLAHERRQAALAELGRQVNVTPAATDDARPMTWEELQTWRTAGMTVGGHTRTHPMLAALPSAELRSEIVAGRRELEESLGVPLDTFAYPYGTAADFDIRCEEAVYEAGYRCAFVNYPGNRALGTQSAHHSTLSRP